MTRPTFAVCLAALTVPVAGRAQTLKPTPPPVPPCCLITAIDLRYAQVSAEESSTGHVFKFEVKNPTILRGLKVGQKVWADFAAGKVTLDPKDKPCCNILTTAPTAPKPPGSAPKSSSGGTDP